MRLLPATILLGLIVPSARLSFSQDSARQYTQVDNWAQFPDGMGWGVMSAVAVDVNGDIYGLSRSEPTSRVIVLDKNGKFLRSFADGEFENAHGLRIFADGIWITDNKREQAFKYDRKGTLLLTLGKKDMPGDAADQFDGVSDVAEDEHGDVFIADGEGKNNRILKFDKNGKFIKIFGTLGSDSGQFHLPHNLAIDPRARVWVCDRTNKRIEIFDLNGQYLDQMTQFGTPSAIAIGKDGIVYVADMMPENRVVVGTIDGKVLGSFGGLRNGHGIAVDDKGNLYVADSRLNTVLKFMRQ